MDLFYQVVLKNPFFSPEKKKNYFFTLSIPELFLVLCLELRPSEHFPIHISTSVSVILFQVMFRQPQWWDSWVCIYKHMIFVRVAFRGSDSPYCSVDLLDLLLQRKLHLRPCLRKANPEINDISCIKIQVSPQLSPEVTIDSSEMPVSLTRICCETQRSRELDTLNTKPSKTKKRNDYFHLLSFRVIYHMLVDNS